MYNKYSPALFGIISQTLGNEKIAEEVLHDAFLKIWNHIDQYDPGKGKLFTWMYRIARNQAIDERRSKGFKDQEKSNDITEFVNTFRSEDMPLEFMGMKSVLSMAGDECQKLILKNFFYGFSHMEIAKNSNLPLGTVKTRIRNCLKKLKPLLKAEFE